MDKETIIKYTLNNNMQSIDLNVIREYCIEKGKNINKIDIFLQILRMDIPYLLHCYNTALEYYQEKFNIVVVIDKDNNVKYAY